MPKKKALSNSSQERLDLLYENVRSVIEQARENIYKKANFEVLQGYWHIGRYIVEDEQSGDARAAKGSALVKKLASKLQGEYGSGFSYSNVKKMKQFYIAFPKGSALRSELSWTHYRILMRIGEEKSREFYITEAIAERWGTRTLERAIGNKLYERTLLAQQTPGDVVDLVHEVKINEGEPDFSPQDFIKDPYNLAFTGIVPGSKLYEKDLEQALMDSLQDFVMELGKGFAFVRRQYRISLEGDHWYIDLVFYNYLLKCFLLIDLKTKKLTHQDIGQMDFYVRFFEKEVRQQNDNPTIGLILCADKNNQMAKYTLLEESETIFASQYQLYLPSEEALQDKLLEEKERLELEQRLDSDQAES